MDIILTRHRGHPLKNLVSRGISWFTRCYWTHVAAVFLVPHREQDFNNTFVMESYGPGVDIHRVEKYFSAESEYDCAVLRVKADWFSGGNASELRQRARGRLLDKVDAGYDRRKVWSGVMRFLKTGPSRMWKTANFRRRRKNHEIRGKVEGDPTDFMCSGFVSYGLFETVVKECRMRGIPEDGPESRDMLEGILLHPALKKGVEGLSRGEISDLVLSTAPVDFVATDRFEWKWMLLGGELHRISDGKRETADRIFRRKYGFDSLDWPRWRFFWES